jgi:hypothetical protein
MSMIGAISMPASADPASTGAAASAQRGRDRFESLMRQMEGGAAKSDELREAAQELVGMTFILPLLKQARQDPFRTPMFHGGFAEDAFGAQLDEQVALGMSRRMDGPLVDAIYRKFARQAAGKGTNLHG